jgi:hypothetical protein
MFEHAGDTVAIMQVLVWPPGEEMCEVGLPINQPLEIIMESRWLGTHQYGTCWDLSIKALTNLP